MANRVAFVALLAGAAALRFATLDSQSLWLDEAVTVGLVRDGFGHLVHAIPRTESTPPLYYVLAWAWAKVFGVGAVGLRSLSAVFGTATVAVAHRLGREIGGSRVALAGAALVAFDPLLVWYSQEARAYALLVLAGLGTVLLWLRALEEPSARRLGWWGACCAVALASHYFAAFLVAPEIAGLLWLRRDRLRAAVPALGGVVLVAAALAPLALHQRTNARVAIGDASLVTRAVQVPKQWLVGYDAPAERTLAVVSALVLAAGGLALLRGARLRDDRRRRALLVAAVAVAGALLPLVLAAAGVDYLISRNVIASVAPLLVVAGAGFASRGAGRAGPLAAAALCGVWLWVSVAVASDPHYQRDDWRGIGRALGAAPPGGRAVVVSPPSGVIPLALYLPGARPAAGTVSVRELDIVGVTPRTQSTRSGPPPVPPLPAQIGSFAQQPTLAGPTWAVVRYVAPAPAPADLAAAEQHAIESHAAALVQSAAGAAQP